MSSQPNQSIWSIERVVVLLTPAFASTAAWLAALVANEVPGAPRLDPGSIRDVEIAAFLSITGVVLKWLHGRQKLGAPPPPVYATTGVASTAPTP